MSQAKKMAMIGVGKMGGALLEGILSRKWIAPEAITVCDKMAGRLEELKAAYGTGIAADNRAALSGADIVILGVKPQNMREVLEEIRDALDEKQLVVSIAAGISTIFIEEVLEKKIRVVRAMPNMPALIGCGATALARGKYATDGDINVSRQVFDAVGISVVVTEDLMDAVTGLSGSGPAYGFMMIEALSDAGVLMGLPRETARMLASQTMLGAAMLCLQGQQHPAALKDMVTSPGGTTIAGIQVLEEGKFRATLMAAVEAAALRSRALGK
ncbi:MAG TPA: pyrroline-5-carboxylate reductase [Syntrophales bacterium]|jgi:pyrroline-5-carboxylate reductase|nr:pyrroline-5-carboxylate reductase [Syntrophales bacterium]HQA82403.1 pyrroline-5-carboxylate reductase [Syntrophales bacterium]